MITLKLVKTADINNPIVGDLALENGTVKLIGDTSATFVEAVAQDVKSRLSFFKSEWFLDTREGVPWYEEILVKSPRYDTIRTIFKQVILGTPHIVGVNSLDLVHERGTRELDMDFNAALDSGQILISSEFAPFLVTF